MFDVIVVGAGPSGLQAALSAQQAGLSVAVLEARNRVGGKVWSVPLASGRGTVDLGAAWINDSLQKRVWAYVKQFGLDVVKQRLEGQGVVQFSSKGKRLIFPFGHTPQFDAKELENFEAVKNHIQNASLRDEKPNSNDDNLTLDQYVRGLGASDNTSKMINVWCKVMHGVESTQESAAFFIDYCRRNKGLLAIRADDHTGGQHLRLLSGAQKIMNEMANLLGYAHIHLSTPIATIHNTTKGVTVTSFDGRSFTGRKCILSIPSTLYKDINIQPPLPQAVQELTGATKLGDYNKSIVCYDRPWWRDLGYNGFFLCYEGYIGVARDTSVDEKGLYCITCFVNGAAGAEWGRLEPHERRRAVLEQIADVFDQDKDSEAFRPIEIFDQIWQYETFSKGALVPITAPGHLTKFASIYGKAVANIHFVGTEYATEWKGYMEGALDSGERGAKEVIAAMGHLRSSL